MNRYGHNNFLVEVERAVMSISILLDINSVYSKLLHLKSK